MSRNDYLAGFEAFRREALDAINESVIHRKVWRKQVNELLRAIRPPGGVEEKDPTDNDTLERQPSYRQGYARALTDVEREVIGADAPSGDG